MFIKRKYLKKPNKYLPSKWLSKLADKLEKNSIIRIWVRINQSFAIFAFLVTAIGVQLAINRYSEDQVKANEDRIAKAWDVVTRMSGKQSNGGQVAAIERLNSMKVSLNKIDLHNTYLAGADLENAQLIDADLSGTVLSGANFRNANLQGANLRSSVLIGVDLTNANLDAADLTNSKIISAKIDLTAVLAKSLSNADLTNSIFVFEDEGGEKWESFADTISEAIDDIEVIKKLEMACAHPNAPPKMNSLIGIHAHYKRCAHEPNYDQLYFKYQTLRGMLPFGYWQKNPFKQ